MTLGLVTLLVLFGGLSVIGMFVRKDGHLHLHDDPHPQDSRTS